MYNSYTRAHAAQFIGEQCLVTVSHMLQERREVLLMSPQRLRECRYQQTLQHTYVAAEILFNTSLVNVAGTSPLIASTISYIAHLVSLFEVISVEHKRLQRFHVHYVRVLICLPC